MHHDLFTATDLALQSPASDRKVPTVEPLPVSSWVAMSALQKGIRRGDIDMATRAAATLLKSDPAKLWRRLVGITFEDVGLGSLETVRLVTTTATDRTFRQQFGGDWVVASLLVERLCAVAKCRATDDLFLTISHHHELAELRVSLAGADLTEHLSRIGERGALLGASLSVLHAAGVRWTRQVPGQASDAKSTFAAMRSAGADHSIVALASQGLRVTREALPPLLPLLSLARSFGDITTQDDEFPPVVIGRNGLPTFIYDAFSREGAAALSRFLKRDTATGRWLRKHITAERRLSVLAGGLFRVDGGLVRQRVEWPCAMTLRWLADSGYHGMKLSDPVEWLDLVRGDLPTIDEERVDVR